MWKVIAWGQKFMAVNRPESEDVAQGQEYVVYVAINHWQPCYNYYISHLIG